MSKPDKDFLIKRGKQIRAIRLSKHVSATELAEYMNINRSSYVRIESGAREMRCFEAVKIAEFLNVHLFQIMSVQSKPLISTKIRDIALKSGFNQWEVGNRFHAFANAVVDSANSQGGICLKI